MVLNGQFIICFKSFVKYNLYLKDTNIKDLTEFCFCRGLKCLVVPMLANMLESDKRRRWSFEQFFREVFKIQDMLTIRLYDCSVGSNLKIYVEKCDR